jgi:hypothetical protein
MKVRLALSVIELLSALMPDWLSIPTPADPITTIEAPEMEYPPDNWISVTLSPGRSSTLVS